jgi:hypothetical protein
VLLKELNAATQETVIRTYYMTLSLSLKAANTFSPIDNGLKIVINIQITGQVLFSAGHNNKIKQGYHKYIQPGVCQITEVDASLKRKSTFILCYFVFVDECEISLLKSQR